MASSKTSRPFTYCIDYGGYRGFAYDPEELIESIAKAPPHLMHLGHDVPIPNSCGPIVPLDDGPPRRITPDEVLARTETIKQLLERLRRAGCTQLIPYVCNQTLMGEPDKRLGIWEFYDHWDEYASLGVGPRPETDPIQWMAREPNGRPHFNYEKRHGHALAWDMFRWAPCCNNPDYNRFQRVVVSHIAQVDYDGVFVDNCNLNCYCEHCQAKFKDFLAAKYSAAELKAALHVDSPAEASLATRGSRLVWIKNSPPFIDFLLESRSDEELGRMFGATDLAEARIEEAGNGWLWGAAHDFRLWLERKYSSGALEQMIGTRNLSAWGIETPQERLLWAETKRFWAASVCENLRMLRETGREFQKDFVISPNWGNLEEPDAAEFREEMAHIGVLWAPGMDFMMFEEGNTAGAVAPGLYNDHILQYRASLALDIQAAVLPYGNQHEGTVSLGYAENLANGGAAYIQPSTRFPAVRAPWRAFIDEHADLLAGARPCSDVGVVYLFDELILENPRHQEWIYHVTRYLSEQHILFDVVTERQLQEGGLAPYRALILAGPQYLSDAQLRVVRAFHERGGVVVLIGNVATHTPFGVARRAPGLHDLAGSGGDRVLVAERPDDLIGPARVSREAALQFATYSESSLNVPSGSAGVVYQLDRMIGVDRYVEARELAPRLEAALGKSLRLADAYDAMGVRFSAFRKETESKSLVLLHIVNYNVPAVPHPQSKPVAPVANLEVALPLGEEWRGAVARVLEPGKKEESQSVTYQDGTVFFVIPTLDIYKLVVLEAG